MIHQVRRIKEKGKRRRAGSKAGVRKGVTKRHREAKAFSWSFYPLRVRSRRRLICWREIRVGLG